MHYKNIRVCSNIYQNCMKSFVLACFGAKQIHFIHKNMLTLFSWYSRAFQIINILIMKYSIRNRESFRCVVANVPDWYVRASEFEHQSSNYVPFRNFENGMNPRYLSHYGSDDTTTVRYGLFGDWITHQGWYAITKQKNETNQSWFGRIFFKSDAWSPITMNQIFSIFCYVLSCGVYIP